ncbi:hypothetical protein OCL06_12035 [Alteromonas sp. ASW11-19]|uniref:Uncharacterized protein n=1 Tax=Alteromonas salexigens TaxID=2982530 RepID=A0ABT2VPT1_9ALTE|nr:hypothetical protein [Alteromonas salexigens]MCU7555319.1 hypothetical protein [Alteromonas salexigens]
MSTTAPLKFTRASFFWLVLAVIWAIIGVVYLDLGAALLSAGMVCMSLYSMAIPARSSLFKSLREPQQQVKPPRLLTWIRNIGLMLALAGVIVNFYYGWQV